MKITRRLAIKSSSIFISPMIGSNAFAQSDWPNRAIRVVCGMPPGSNMDIIFRIVSDALSKELNQPIIVENKVGASSILAVSDVARANPDGYTMLMTIMSSFVGNRVLFKNLPYKHTDFSPISQIAFGNVILAAKADAPYDNAKEFIEWARNEKRKISCGNNGQGNSLHVFAHILEKNNNLDFNHVSYKSGTVGLQDLSNGLLDISFTSSYDIKPYIDSGKLKIIGVTGKNRISTIPDTPTFEELGIKGLDLSVWAGAYFPAKTDTKIVNKANAALVKVLQQPAVRERIESLGQIPIGSTIKDFEDSYEKTFPLWEKHILATGVQPS